MKPTIMEYTAETTGRNIRSASGTLNFVMRILGNSVERLAKFWFVYSEAMLQRGCERNRRSSTTPQTEFLGMRTRIFPLKI